MSFEPINAPNPSRWLPTRWNRRTWLASLVTSMTAIPHLAWGEEPPKTQEEAPTFRIRSVLEFQGEVRLKNQGASLERRNGKQVVARTVPVRSSTTLDYDEQYRCDGDAGDTCLQYYHEAATEIQVDSNTTKTQLRESCREIVKHAAPSGIVSASPAQPLFAAERDLVEGSLTTMYLDDLLTDAPVSIGDKWNVDSAAIAKLLNLDAVHDGELTVCLVDNDKEQAHLVLEGRLTGSVRNVATEMVVEGKAILDRRGGYISWLAMQTQETREIGEAEPGFRIIATLRVLRAPVESMSHGRALDEALRDIPSWESAEMLQFQSDRGFYRFLADRRWTTYRDNGEEATLRFIVGNRRVAQCNFANLIDYEPGRQLSLEGFQSDVQRLIAAGGHEILEASERLSTTKHRLLRIVVAGITEGVPIRWIYYHVSNDTGRRLSMTFTLDEASLETFAEQDQVLAGTVELLSWPKKLDPAELKDEKAGAQTESARTPPKSSKR
jgi:hypothetical protein